MRDYKKNRKMFHWFSKHNGDNSIIFIQESHSSLDVVDEWSKRTRGNLIMSHGTSKSKGTAILIGEKLTCTIREKRIDDNGRFIILLIEMQGSHLLIINSYFPNFENQQVKFMKDIVENINSLDYPIDTFIVWGGDFNFYFDLNLETLGGHPKLKVSSIEMIENIMLEFDLCDIWRIRNPDSKRYTWKGQFTENKKKQTIFRRLDYFLISNELQPFTINPDIIPTPSTDHSTITLKIQTPNS